MRALEVDRLLAEAGAALSWASVHTRRSIGGLVIGRDPRVTPLVYRAAATPAEEVRWGAHFQDKSRREPADLRDAAAQWVEHHLPFPAYYSRVGVVQMKLEAMQRLEEENREAVRVIAWRYGRIAMYGVLPDGQEFPSAYAMRIPEGGSLDTTSALLDPVNRRLISPETGVVSQLTTEAGAFSDLSEGLAPIRPTY